MKRDAALAALNSNYIEQWRARCLLMSLEVFWGSDMETKPYIKVSVAEVGGSQKIDFRLSTTSKWRDEPASPRMDECVPWSIQRFALLSQRPFSEIHSISTEGWQGWKGVARSTIEKSGLSHEGKSIRTLRWTVNIYPFSLTTIEFPWWALTVQRERSELMAIVLHSSKCIICLIQWQTLHQTRESPAAYW